MSGKQVTELEKLTEFNDDCIVPTHNGVGLKKGTIGDLSEYLGTKFSNPNLLINPDFNINQRGSTVYDYSTQSSEKYTVDRWRCNYLKVTPSDSGVTLEATSNNGYFTQQLENEVEGIHTMSFEVSEIIGTVVCTLSNSNGYNKKISVTKTGVFSLELEMVKKVQFYLPKGSKCKIVWTKLENGINRTKFIKPNSSEEILKCRFFYRKINIDDKIVICLGYNVYIYFDNLSMRTPTITLKNKDGYEQLNLMNLKNITVLNSISYWSRLSNTCIAINTNFNNTTDIFITYVGGAHILELDAEIY